MPGNLASMPCSREDPLLYELNTRAWLRRLSAIHREKITLGNIPASEFDQWQQAGFSHIWLMGVWMTGPKARAEALRVAGLHSEYSQALPDLEEGDIGGSPYAIADYRVPEEFGGDAGLAEFRRALNRRSLRLILDFVPNHLGIDHPWIQTNPELFVPGSPGHPESFAVPSNAEKWLQHGKDPNFSAWTDTAQLDYRRVETRDAMRFQAERIAASCDGVRCDMAMLVLSEVFTKTWGAFPVSSTDQGEFWRETISAVKRQHPDFLFLAEVYWGLENELQELGFDYTYDKTCYDLIVAQKGAELQSHLLNQTPVQLARSAHFLENHDEQRIASLLNFDHHRAAALLILCLPGMRLLHEGQLEGWRRRVPVQLLRRHPEAGDHKIQQLYHEVLGVLRATGMGNGNGQILRPQALWEGDSSAKTIILIQWENEKEQLYLVTINFSPQPANCLLRMKGSLEASLQWKAQDLVGDRVFEKRGSDLLEGFEVSLKPWESCVFSFSPLKSPSGGRLSLSKVKASGRDT